MRQSDPRRLFIAFAAIAVLLLLSFTFYTVRSNDFAATQPPASTQPAVANSYVLESQLPADVYRYTTARIDDYLSANGLTASTMRIDASVTTNNPYTYTFKIILLPQATTLNVGVQVSNFSSILSTAVYVDGQLQNPQVATQSSSGMQVDNLSALSDSGLTTLQVNAFVSALQKFDPSANSASIDTSTITHKPGTIPVTYTFNLSVSGTSYRATLRLPSLSSAQLLLKDTNNKQVFDSGVVTSN